MKENDFFRNDVNANYNGSITIDNKRYAAELNVIKRNLVVRFFDFNNKLSRDFSSLNFLETAVFYSGD